MKLRRGCLVAAALVLIILAITNPNEASLRDEMDNRVRASADGFLDRVIGFVATSALKYNLVYRNYVFFSVAETRIGKQRVTYFGALGNWWSWTD